ncbi:MAG: thiamine pyrophosphate-binding protein [Caldilineaceae bacterium SB0668_bin_21]|nr:thiamine pyrophosphate-binding protein [Caldilineaceae bacterium SB0668_bin_21]MYC21803.1 thiamine pyrophosphate-binding protein [Caldilineaceae bacterium SB0662_bin_25]
MARMRCAEALVRALELEGVRHVVGHPGHGNTNILDAIYDSSQISFKLTRHEQAAAHIADGYARISGDIGVCCASVGPGPANMVMGLASAAAASSPVVAIFGGVISRWVGRGQLQETSPFHGLPDQSFVQVLQPVVKKVWQVQHPDLIPEVVRKACGLARAGNPCPVAIEIPWDLQAAFHDFDEIPDPKQFGYAGRVRADAAAIGQAAEALQYATHPIIVAGYGAVLSDAGPEIRELAELLGAPVATSYAAKGIVSEDHAQSVGNLGWLGHPSAHEYIREYADVVLAVGFSFSDLSTCWWTEGMPFVEQNRFIQVDIDANQIGRTYPVKVGLLGDAKATLHEIVDELSAKEAPQYREANQELIEKIKSDFCMDIPGEEGGATGMEPLRVVEELRRVLPRDILFSLDTGDHNHYFGAFFPIYSPRRLLYPGGWTPMGFGPTSIIGGKLARPDLPAVCVTGDGGFLMVCQEVITAVEWGLPVVWVVFNNQTLGAIRGGQQGSYGGRVIGTEFCENADYAALAKSLRAEGLTVNRYCEIEEAMSYALACGRPCVIDMRIARDPAPPPIAGMWFEPERDEIPPRPRR